MIRVLFWNIQIYGKRKAGQPVNDVALTNFIAAVVHQYDVDVLALCELTSSSTNRVQTLLRKALAEKTKSTWQSVAIVARPNGNKEAYGFFWRATVTPLAVPRFGCAGNEFPGNDNLPKGRRAAYIALQTPATEFIVAAYHAPTRASQPQGIAALAAVPEITQHPCRFLCGDFNLDYGQFFDDYTVLTARAGPDCAPVITAASPSTLLRPFSDFNEDPHQWAGDLVYLPANKRIDNIFTRPLSARGSGSIDLIDAILNSSPSIRRAALGFTQKTTASKETYTGADRVRYAGGLNTSNGAYAFCRAAVSDHLPVLAIVP